MQIRLYLITFLFILLTKELSCKVAKDVNVVHIIIIGATGDLSTRYLWVACFRLALQTYTKTSHTKFNFIAGGIENFTKGKIWKYSYFHTLDFKERVCGKRVYEYQYYDCDQFLKNEFLPHIQYVQLATSQDYSVLGHTLDGFNEIGRIVYLAIPPNAFIPVCTNIHLYLLPRGYIDELKSPFLRLIVEKPFGKDFDSAEILAKELLQYFNPNDIYLMDHYMGKRVVQDLYYLFQRHHADLHHLWCAKYLRQVNIVMHEKETVETRIQYFHNVGIIRDVMVNHLHLLLGLSLSPSFHNRYERLQFFNSLRVAIEKGIIVGQYDEYMEHFKRAGMDQLVNEKDDNRQFTEWTITAAEVPLDSSLDKWKVNSTDRPVNFILTAIKSSDRRNLSIKWSFQSSITGEVCNLTVTIQEKEEISLDCSPPSHNITTDSSNLIWQPLKTFSTEFASNYKDTQHNDHEVWELGDQLTAYDRLFKDIFHGHTQKFMTIESILMAWRIWSPILRRVALYSEVSNQNITRVYYPTGSPPW